ncbi:MAG: hypothetical protein H8E78_01725 [Proteobacteria bacterium]|nr:hypothetical protein [Pseudomonadota bacterium]
MTAGAKGSLLVFYPMTHWLAMMLLSWTFSRFLLARPEIGKRREDTEKLLILCGLSALLLPGIQSWPSKVGARVTCRCRNGFELPSRAGSCRLPA